MLEIQLYDIAILEICCDDRVVREAVKSRLAEW